MNDKILVLGASNFIVPLIKKVREKGYKSIVCSNKKTDPGLNIADIPLAVSILNREKLLEVIHSYSPKAIVTSASDLATLSLGYLNEKFDLPGIKEGQVLAVTDKGNFISLQRQLDLPHPTSFSVENNSDLENLCRNPLNFPKIMKPFFSSGSRGVIVVNNKEEIRRHHADCKEASYGREGYVLQEYLEDYKEIGCEALILNGQVAFLETTHKYLNSQNVPLGHCMPGPTKIEIKDKIKDQLEIICEALGVNNTPVNLDIMVRENLEPVIIDLGFRLGGNMLPELISQTYGVDPYAIVIDLALKKEKVIDVSKATEGFFGSIIFGSAREKKFSDRLKKEIESILEDKKVKTSFDIKVGDMISPFTKGSNGFGYAILRCKSLDEFETYKDELEDIINY